MFEFLKKNLNFVKEVLYVDLLKEKDKYGNIILHNLFYYTNSLDVVKYVFKMYKLHFPELFLKKDYKGPLVINNLLFYNNSLSTLIYVLNFFKKHYPILFFKKQIRNNSFNYNRMFHTTHDPKKFLKCFLKFYIINFPFLSLNLRFSRNLMTNIPSGYDILKKNINLFYKYNFPEKSRFTNNFILPLIMEIQN